MNKGSLLTPYKYPWEFYLKDIFGLLKNYLEQIHLEKINITLKKCTLELVHKFNITELHTLFMIFNAVSKKDIFTIRSSSINEPSKKHRSVC